MKVQKRLLIKLHAILPRVKRNEIPATLKTRWPLLSIHDVALSTTNPNEPHASSVSLVAKPISETTPDPPSHRTAPPGESRNIMGDR
jgi:hypothetical protein